MTAPGAIWNEDRITPALEAALAGAAHTTEARRAAAAVLAAERDRGRAVMAAALADNPRDAMPVVRAISHQTDLLLRSVLDIATRLHPAASGSLALVATGGCGRGEMAPFSDIDLLFLTSAQPGPGAARIVETALYLLWDMNLSIGHATRGLGDCLQLARDDMIVRTSLLETRHVAGDQALARQLQERLQREVFSLPPASFITAKLVERQRRHRRQGGQRYMVEPDVKEGKGALRDLQSLYWIARHVTGAESPAEMVRRGLFSAEEHGIFTRAAAFLWAVRCHLHLAADHAEERLTFDIQPEVARRMGYGDHDGRRGVEHFMQDYFRHATLVGDLTRILLAALEARQQMPGPPPAVPRHQTRAPFILRRGRLGVGDHDVFLADPVNIIAAFAEAQRLAVMIHPDTLRLIAANLARIDDDLRHDPRAARLFLDLLTRHGNPEHALRRMNETGVLGAFIPEFGTIVAMMQFNTYHRYTVDEHTIQAISHLSRIERGEAEAELPISTDILRRGVNRRVLHVALLLHDTGKGREEDHSLAGARIARAVAPRLGLNRRDAEKVEWLVRHHLLMSDMAQKRDISDPRTLRDFVRVVGTQERLDLLTVLTVCDIRGVGPGVWNNWKAVLLRRLRAAASAVIARGDVASALLQDESAARRALRSALAGWPGADIDAELRRHEPRYWQGLPGEIHLAFAHLLRGTRPGETRLALAPEPAQDATRICITMPDAPGLFARMAGAVSATGANVVDARTYTTRDGRATAVFRVQDQAARPYADDRMARLERRIGERLADGDAAQAPEGRAPATTHEFRVPTVITLDNDASETCTVIEVDTHDRPGLLHDLSRAIADSGAQISSAIIVTYGEQAVDTFYVRDRFGRKLPEGAACDVLLAQLQTVSEG